jgi:hypothetical protein
MTPSFTATTGEPEREKMSIERRSSADSTTLAAFSPLLTRFSSSASARSSAYRARAYTGKRPSVRPVSEPIRSAGTPAIRRARSSTESTYQSAWL